MRKTYTITVDRAKAQTFSKGLIWHNDKDSTKTVQCEESIEDVKKKVLDEIRQFVEQDRIFVSVAYTEDVDLDLSVNARVEKPSDLEVIAIGCCTKAGQRCDEWIRVRAFEDWNSWIKDNAAR